MRLFTAGERHKGDIPKTDEQKWHKGAEVGAVSPDGKSHLEPWFENHIPGATEHVRIVRGMMAPAARLLSAKSEKHHREDTPKKYLWLQGSYKVFKIA